VPLLVAFAMAALTASARLLAREVFEADDLADVSSARDVFGSGSVATLASMSVLESRFKVGGSLKVLLVKLFMASLAYIDTDVFGRLFTRLRIFLLLTGGDPRLNQQRQHEPGDNQTQNVSVSSLPVHDQ
jgi:hypothetical protein